MTAKVFSCFIVNLDVLDRIEFNDILVDKELRLIIELNNRTGSIIKTKSSSVQLSKQQLTSGISGSNKFLIL